jgi:hypothetical protein
MASIVSAGTTSATALNMSADTTGILQLASNNGTVAVTINTSQNVGFGVIPSAWGSPVPRAIQVGTSSLAWGSTDYSSHQTANAFFNGSNWAYISTAYASIYSQINGTHSWRTAPSGTAGNSISLSTAMTLDAVGQLQVGTTAGNSSAGGGHFTGPIVQGASGLSQQQISISSGNTIQSLVLGVGYYPLYLQPLGSNVIVGTTSNALLGIITASYNTNSTSSPTLLVRNGGGSAAFVTFSDSGSDTTIYGSITRSGSNTVYNTSSDYRLKNITGALTGYKERLMSLQPKQGTWIVNGTEFRGFLAHEFAEPYRTSVVGEKDAVDEKGKPIMQAMQASSSEVMADLVALVQELTTRLEALENK